MVLEVGEFNLSSDTFQYYLNYYHSYYYLPYMYVMPTNEIVNAELRSRQVLLGQRCDVAFFFVSRLLGYDPLKKSLVRFRGNSVSVGLLWALPPYPLKIS